MEDVLSHTQSDLIDQIASDIKQIFSDLSFVEESHTYLIDSQLLSNKKTGLHKLPSVSKQITNFYEKFDTSVAYYVAKRDNKTTEEVLQEWEDKKNQACELGSRVHDFAEGYMNGCAKPSCDMELGVVQFLKDIPEHVIPILYELPVYSKQFRYAGTIDVVLLNTKTGKLVLGDWKTNKDLFKNYKNKKLLAPFNDLLDNPFNKYRLQLSHYSLCLEEVGYPVEELWLMWLKPDKENFTFYQHYKLDSLSDRLKLHYNYDEY